MAEKGVKRSKILNPKNMSLLIGVLIIIIMVSLLQKTIIVDAIESRSMNLNFFMTDVFHRPEEISEGVYRINKSKGLRSDVVIFGFDEKSLAELGRYPWPRSVYARFLDNINAEAENRPAGVLIDVLFTEDSQDKGQDRTLANALRKYNRSTVIDLFADQSSQIPNVGENIKRRLERIGRLGIPASDESEQFVNVITPPIIEIIDSGVLIGPATALPGLNPKLAAKGADKITRRFTMVVKINERYYPSTVLWMAMLHYKVGIDDVLVNMGENIILKNGYFSNLIKISKYTEYLRFSRINDL